jgi:hypothetical protein
LKGTSTDRALEVCSVWFKLIDKRKFKVVFVDIDIREVVQRLNQYPHPIRLDLRTSADRPTNLSQDAFALAIAQLSNMTSLSVGHIASYYQSTRWSPLTVLTNLRSLTIQSPSPELISSLYNLQTLSCWDCSDIKDASCLAPLTDLKDLWLGFDDDPRRWPDLSNIFEILKNPTKITSLTLRSAYIDSSELTRLSNLRALEIFEGAIKLHLSPLTALESLELHGIDLTEENVGALMTLEKLTRLQCDYCHLPSGAKETFMNLTRIEELQIN